MEKETSVEEGGIKKEEDGCKEKELTPHDGDKVDTNTVSMETKAANTLDTSKNDGPQEKTGGQKKGGRWKNNNQKKTVHSIQVYPVSEKDNKVPTIKSLLEEHPKITCRFIAQRGMRKKGVLSLNFNDPESQDKVLKELSSVKESLPPECQIQAVTKQSFAHRECVRGIMSSVSEMKKEKDDNVQPVSVFFNNLPVDAQVEMLHFLYPTSSHIDLPVDGKGECLGYAVLQFRDLEEARCVVDNHKAYPVQIGGVRINMHIIGHGGKKNEGGANEMKRQARLQKRKERRRKQSTGDSSSPKKLKEDIGMIPNQSSLELNQPSVKTKGPEVKSSAPRKNFPKKVVPKKGDLKNVTKEDAKNNVTKNIVTKKEDAKKDVAKTEDGKNVVTKKEDGKNVVAKNEDAKNDATKKDDVTKKDDANIDVAEKEVVSVKVTDDKKEPIIEAVGNTDATKKKNRRKKKRKMNSEDSVKTDDGNLNTTTVGKNEPSEGKGGNTHLYQDVFIGNLTIRTDPVELKQFLLKTLEEKKVLSKSFNPIVEIKSVPKRAFKFAVFRTARMARRAVPFLDGVMFNGKNLSIELQHKKDGQSGMGVTTYSSLKGSKLPVKAGNNFTRMNVSYRDQSAGDRYMNRSSNTSMARFRNSPMNSLLGNPVSPSMGNMGRSMNSSMGRSMNSFMSSSMNSSMGGSSNYPMGRLNNYSMGGSMNSSMGGSMNSSMRGSMNSSMGRSMNSSMGGILDMPIYANQAKLLAMSLGNQSRMINQNSRSLNQGYGAHSSQKMLSPLSQGFNQPTAQKSKKQRNRKKKKKDQSMGLNQGPNTPGKSFQSMGLNQGPNTPGKPFQSMGLNQGSNTPGKQFQSMGLNQGSNTPGKQFGSQATPPSMGSLGFNPPAEQGRTHSAGNPSAQQTKTGNTGYYPPAKQGPGRIEQGKANNRGHFSQAEQPGTKNISSYTSAKQNRNDKTGFYHSGDQTKTDNTATQPFAKQVFGRTDKTGHHPQAELGKNDHRGYFPQGDEARADNSSYYPDAEQADYTSYYPPAQQAGTGNVGYYSPAQQWATGNSGYYQPEQQSASGNTGYYPPAQQSGTGNTDYYPPAQQSATGNTGYYPPTQQSETSNTGYYPPAQQTGTGNTGYFPQAQQWATGNTGYYPPAQQSGTGNSIPAEQAKKVDSVQDKPGEHNVYFGNVPTCIPAEFLDFIKKEFLRRGLCEINKNPVKRLNFSHNSTYQYVVFGNPYDANVAVEELNGVIFKGSKLVTKSIGTLRPDRTVDHLPNITMN